jgi:predicted enzyme related to lactoylglutathione lyase
MTEIATLTMLNLDCADPQAQAEFYAQVLGWEVTHSQAEYAMISGTGTPIGFGRTENYTPPKWPDPANGKRYHLDLRVDDLDKAEQRCVELGATKPEFQPGERWRVMLDPTGQPFCLCLPS